MPTALPLPLSTPNRNLVRLTIVRGITWTGFLMAIIVGIELLAFNLPVTAVVSVVIAMGMLNIATWWRLGRQGCIGHWGLGLAGCWQLLAGLWAFGVAGGARCG